MASVKMTDEKCARCERRLAEGNTNPDRLCGYCQRNVNVKVWHASGRLRVPWCEGPRAGAKPVVVKPRRRHHKRNGLPDVGTLPVPYLIACRKELKRRVAVMERDVALLRKAAEED